MKKSENGSKIMLERRKFLKFVAATVATRPVANMFPRPVSTGLAESDTEPDVQIGGLPPNWTGIHWQWEWPCWVSGAGQQFNARAYVSGLLESGVQMIHILTRAEPGLWHFPTQIGFERDCTGRDWVLEVLDELQRQGAAERIKVIFYFTASLDSSAARARPTWQQFDKDDIPLTLSGQWNYVCLNSPWRDYCFSIMNEAADTYASRYPGVVGFYVDEPHFAQYGCYCMWCQDGFRNMFGAELPRDFSVDRNLWMNMHRFQVESVIRFLKDIDRQVIAQHPEMVWTWNGLSVPSYWEPRVWLVSSYNSMEAEAGYLWALAWSKQLASYGKPFEIAFGRDTSWTDQKARPVHELKTLQGISVVHGGGVLIGDYPYPSGKLRANGLAWGNEVFRWKNSIQPWLDGAKSLSEVALLESRDANWVRAVQAFNRDTAIWEVDRANTSFYTWAKLLVAANVQFDVISEDNLNTLSKYKAVILPDLLYLADATIQALDRYVQAGGNLLSTFRTGLYDRNGGESPSAGLFNLLGVRFRQWSSYKGNYLWIDDPTLKRDLSPEPLLIKGPALLCEATTAQPMAWVTFPIEELASDRQVWAYYNPPRDNHESFPSVALNRRGRGQVLSIFHPVEDVVRTEDYWAAEGLLLNALARLVPERLIKITAPSEVIALTTTQPERRRVVVHLFNEAIWTGSKFLTDPGSQNVNGRQSPSPWKRPAVSNVQVDLKVPFPSVTRVYEAPDGRGISFQVRGGIVSFTVPRVDTHTVVVVEQ